MGYSPWGHRVGHDGATNTFIFTSYWSRLLEIPCVWLFATLWTSLSLGFPRQEYWSGLPFPTPGDLPDPGIKPTSLETPALAGGFFTTSATWEAHVQPSELTVSTCVSVKCPSFLAPPPTPTPRPTHLSHLRTPQLTELAQR